MSNDSKWSSGALPSPESRGYMHARTQRRVIGITLIVTAILALVLVPLMVSPELRLSIAQVLNLVPDHDSETIADADSGARLLVLPIDTRLGESDLPAYRHLAAYIAWPDGEGMRLESLNDDGEATIPFQTLDIISAALDGSEMYLGGPEGGAVIDVETSTIVQELEPGEAPDVDWDWQSPVWTYALGICDTFSMEPQWIACFARPTLATYLAGDWHLRLYRVGNPDNQRNVDRGLGFRPNIGFTRDDTWMYAANEHGIWRYNVAEVTQP